MVNVESVAEEVVPVDEATKDAHEGRQESQVGAQVADRVVQEEDVGGDGDEEEDEAQEDYPEGQRPGLHDAPVKGELRENAVVEVGELEAYEEGKDPNEVVVLEDLGD